MEALRMERQAVIQGRIGVYRIDEGDTDCETDNDFYSAFLFLEIFKI